MLAPISLGSLNAIRLQGAGLSLTEGSQVSARVLKQVEGGRFLLSIGGKNFTADSKLPLLPGQVLKVQVQSIRGTVYLRMSGAENAPITAYLRSEGISQDRLSQTIVQAFMRSGLALDANGIRSARRLFGQRGDVDQRLIRTYAIARDKGIQLGPAELEELSQWIDGAYEGESDARRNWEGNREKQGQQKGNQTQDEGHGSTESSAGASVAAGAVTLFNHLQGSEGHWVVLPIAFYADGERTAGSLRLLLDRPALAVRFACCSVRTRALEFDVAWARGSSTAHLYTNDPGRVEPFKSELLGCLQYLGVTEIDISEDYTEWDGFATNVQTNIIQGVDERA